MSTTTPTWTDNVTVIASVVLARGSTSRGTLDLRAKLGGRVFLKAGRGGTSAITADGLVYIVRPVLNNDAAGGVHPFYYQTPCPGTAAVATTVNSDSNSGQAALNVAAIGAIVAGNFICIQDSGGGVTRLEYHRVSKVAAGVLTLDRNLSITHTAAQADTVRSQADILAPIFIPGGSLYEIIVDYGAASAGDSITIQVLAQTFDSLGTV
jgi:hypothetical protein